MDPGCQDGSPLLRLQQWEKKWGLKEALQLWSAIAWGLSPGTMGSLSGSP